MSKPITPNQAIKLLVVTFPDSVIDSFNQLLLERFDGNEAIINQDEIAKIIAKKMGITLQKVYDKGYLNIEELYRKAGWDVKYDKPGYNEDYAAYFSFRRKK